MIAGWRPGEDTRDLSAWSLHVLPVQRGFSLGSLASCQKVQKHVEQLEESNCCFLLVAVTEQNKKTYAYISTVKTWTSAQEHCRTHYTDLAMIENSAENTDVDSVRPAKVEAWIGLYRVPWVWADKSQSSFRYWRSSSPNNYGGNQFCMTEHSGTHHWDDGRCSDRYVFLCHQGNCCSITAFSGNQ
uniref:C-type lectin domain-containing protein n=1 Tax=Stegastes partitus TaxID=144197 RepID=A0A3B4ZPJ8_9TELE